MEEQNQRLTDQDSILGLILSMNRTEMKDDIQPIRGMAGRGSVNIPKIQISISLYDRLNGMILENGAGVLQDFFHLVEIRRIQ